MIPDFDRLTLPANRLSRRAFLRTIARAGISLTGFGILTACGSPTPAPVAADLAPETTTIRLMKGTGICVAPSWMAEDLLKEEGFTEVKYVNVPSNNVVEALSSGQIDMGLQFSGPIITYVDAGKPITVLAGIHVGCFVLFGTERVNEIGDLKGKTLAITAFDGPEHIFLSSMLAYVGLDPITDITWKTLPLAEAQQLFTDGKIDAFLAFPPVAQELEAKKIGHVVVNSMMDKPWSQYFCCMATANREFVQKNPVATKRTLRALLKATDICALQPERAARFLVDKGYANNYDYALAAMQSIPYNVWRKYDPADTLRFYALRLHDVRMIKTTPDDIIARGADWSFLNKIKVELKS
jgi:NitT/TauT family transport system substrate-binding protein